MDSTLKSYLEKYKVNYTLYEHPAVFTVTESDEVTKHIPGARSKNLFLKDDQKKFYLICMPGHKRLDMKALKLSIKVKELHFASPEDLKKELNLTPGSVSIFGMIHASHTKLLIDKELWEANQVGFHPNINTSTLLVNHQALEIFCKSLSSPWEVVSLA
ncbi:MAG: prolyl-tRNA synthetase associated domain-containing protein [Nanoarchaeota archaeon]